MNRDDAPELDDEFFSRATEHNNGKVSCEIIYGAKLWLNFAPDSFIKFYSGKDTTEILRISKDGIFASPDVSVDEIAQKVLDALDGSIKCIVESAVYQEREACAKLCESAIQQCIDEYNDACQDCAEAIRKRSKV